MRDQSKWAKSESGFSLVELIVTVAIIGILASIAIPMYERFAFAAKQSEMKTQMSALFSAEKAFYSEYQAYHSHFSAIGYSPEGNIRFNIGFSGFGNIDAGPANGYFATTPGIPITSIANYCSNFVGGLGVPGNNCFLMKTYTDVLIDISLGFVVTPTDFIIGSGILIPANIASNSHNNSKFNVAERFAAFLETRAEAYGGSTSSIRRISSNVWSLNSKKVFANITCTYDLVIDNLTFLRAAGASPDANGNLVCPAPPTT